MKIKKLWAVIVALALLSGLQAVPPAVADNVPQTVATVSVDVQKLSSGFRASKIIGAKVVNDDNDAIGKVDDLIVSPDDNRTAFAVLSVGGTLGLSSHLIAVPFNMLAITKNAIVLAGVSKEQLKAMPAFKYNPN